MTKSNAKMTKTQTGWKVSDGLSSGEGSTPEWAYEAYCAAKTETEAFTPDAKTTRIYRLEKSNTDLYSALLNLRGSVLCHLSVLDTLKLDKELTAAAVALSEAEDLQ
jgi:hypothetical protein